MLNIAAFFGAEIASTPAQLANLHQSDYEFSPQIKKAPRRVSRTFWAEGGVARYHLNSH